MKIIEAMKQVKANRQKIVDLQGKIEANSAHLSFETPVYENTPEKVRGRAQSCVDLSQDNIKLLTGIAKTNNEINVTIEIGNKAVTKTIAEWIWRRREYADIDLITYSKMTDRGLKEGKAQSSTGIDMDIKLVRNYDPEHRDRMKEIYRSEKGLIDAALEVVNATTDLIE